MKKEPEKIMYEQIGSIIEAAAEYTDDGLEQATFVAIALFDVGTSHGLDTETAIDMAAIILFDVTDPISDLAIVSALAALRKFNKLPPKDYFRGSKGN